MQAFTIDPNSWAALNRLLDAALDLPESERVAWVESLGPEYVQLKPRLLDLLMRAGQSGASGFLDTIPKVGVAEDENIPWSPSHQPEDKVGPYCLEKELGEGGMGTVWLARRSDGMIHRPVALKLPRGTWRRNRLAERMAREREILASLNHPNIARLYDAGLTADGQPYLALEYVEGWRIDEYCDKEGLDIKSRLTIFLQVVSAVEHAHAQLVVHRDLKPSNILVTGDGQVRLLDFGIAKLLEQGQASETEITEAAGRALTPDYASPEQIAGRPIGAASDVYSLGVVLYELSTGDRPYRLQRGSRGALEEAILRSEPKRPSEAAKYLARRKALRGDLDWIILKALAKDVDRRYPSAAALRMDLVRHLQHQPIEAGPPSASYRVAKFIRRHRLGVAAATLITLSMIGGTVGATVGLLRAREAEAQARAQAATAERESSFLADLFNVSSPDQAQGRELTAREILDRGAARIRTELAGEPLVEAHMLRTVGTVYTQLGLYTEASPLLEDSVKTSRPLGGRGQVELALALHALGNLHRLTENVTAAEAELRESLAILDRSPPNQDVDIGPVLNSLALLLRTRNPDEALRLYQRTHDLLLARNGHETGDSAIILQNIAAIHSRARRYEEARRSFEEALPLLIKFFGPNDYRLGRTFNNLALVYRNLGNYSRALELTKRDLAVTSRALGPTHPEVGISWLNLARITDALGDDRAALDQTEKAAAIFRAHFAPGHLLRITTGKTRAVLMIRLGQYDTARAALDSLLTLSPPSVEGKRALLDTRLVLAELDRISGRFPQSLQQSQLVLDDPLSAKDPNLPIDAHWQMAYTLARELKSKEAGAQRQIARQLEEARAVPVAPRVFSDAKFFACAGNTELALDVLTEGVQSGFHSAIVLNDPAFAVVRRDPGFAAIAASIKSAGAP